MPDIVLDQVTRLYGKEVRAVSDLTLAIPDGSFTTLLGPSGCGKTTTLRMIAGLDMPTSGTIRIGDRFAFSLAEGVSLPPAKRGLGLVFQSYALWPHLTVAQNISFGLEVQKVPRAEARQRLEQVATALQIDGLLDRYTSELSGGQQQRVAIARVLVMKPSVLLLDEPLSNLDATLRMDMRAELKRLHQETEATIIYVTHDQLEALTMSTHIALMQAGELQQFAPPLEVYAQPANQFAADFLGNPRINLLEGRVARGVFHSAGLDLALPDAMPLPESAEVTLGLRAEEFRLHDTPGPARAPARVTTLLPTGSDWYYHVDMAGKSLIVRQNDAPHLRLGDTVHVEARPESYKIFGADGRALAGVP
ncbi:MAG: ABC transporter ATP-binding protein [Rhodobacteraceae bacterium]|nr:MAG: ABC transporter ATP-binding protein [Paracoccaceae bacterium]